jgi:hypothetical protein
MDENPYSAPDNQAATTTDSCKARLRVRDYCAVALATLGVLWIILAVSITRVPGLGMIVYVCSAIPFFWMAALVRQRD